MSVVEVHRVEVLNNPATFTTPFAFEIEYSCMTSLAEDLEWKMIYVGSAESEKFDQELDSVMVGPVVPGSYKFIFEGNPPDPSKLPQGDIVGVTVILLTCSYKGKEFIRIGYYLNNEYEDEQLKESPPETPLLDKLSRSILATDPRVTRFPCDFDAEPSSNDAGMEVADSQQAGESLSPGETTTWQQQAQQADSGMMMDIGDAVASLQPGLGMGAKVADMMQG